jgi:hypothetical protein
MAHIQRCCTWCEVDELVETEHQPGCPKRVEVEIRTNAAIDASMSLWERGARDRTNKREAQSEDLSYMLGFNFGDLTMATQL